MTTAEQSTLDRMQAVVDHARAHGLDAHVSTVSVYYGCRVNLHATDGEQVPPFLTWARTLADVTLRHTVTNNGTVHLYAEGRLDSGVECLVVMVLDAATSARWWEMGPDFPTTLSALDEFAREVSR